MIIFIIFGFSFLYQFIGARSNSQRLRSDVDNLVTQCANDMWTSWNTSNTGKNLRKGEIRKEVVLAI